MFEKLMMKKRARIYRQYSKLVKKTPNFVYDTEIMEFMALYGRD